MDRGSKGRYLVLASLLALLGVVLVYPIWLTVRGAFLTEDGGFTFYHVLDVLRDESLRGGLVNALIIATATTILSTVLAMPLALVAAKHAFPGKAIFSALVLIPLILPPFVGAIGVRHLLGRSGSLNTLLADMGILDAPFDLFGTGGMIGVIVVEALHLYPIIYLNLLAALANLDPALDEAARNVGAGPWTRFRRITLPLVRPGLFAGGTITFIWSFTELGTPLMFEFRQVTPVQIFDGLKQMETSAEPFALTVVMLSTAVLLYLAGRVLPGVRGVGASAKASRGDSETRLGGWRGIGASILFATVIGVAALPHVGVVLASVSVEGQWYQSILPRAFTLANYEEALGHPLAIGSIRNSLMLAGIAVLLDLVIGIVAARIIVRTRLRGRSLLDALCMLPLAVPGLVMAFGYVALSLEWPFRGPMPGWLAAILPASIVAPLDDGPLSWAADILGANPNPIPLLIIAYAVRRLPYVVRATVAGLEQTPIDLEEAARGLGAGKWLVLRRIVVPLVAANLIAGALLAFSFAMLEVSDSLILAQREGDYPITKAIYVLFERLGDGPGIAAAMGTWAMLLLACTLAGASLLLGRKLGAVFRA
ncbi:MAG: iron ABC transporter permease [Planctomycetota bacterium]|nr:iron ABC transporter permease [Planctomycetota bacterium]MEE2895139.1 iron ABC transporter permease [Planctomycetota bacterium]